MITGPTQLYRCPFCGGDDWQSIYRFSGSDMSLFSDFSKYFGYTEECRIETTYRFGNPAIAKSSAFIQQNPSQRKKDVKPHMFPNHDYGIEPDQPEMISKTTDIVFVPCMNGNMLEAVTEIVGGIPNDSSVYIIGRYTYDSTSLDDGCGSVIYDAARQEIKVIVNGRKIPYLTIHSSKGLEADHVIMINCNSGIHGFPSHVTDEPVLDYVLSDSDHFEYGEERRVFYVGVTRAKRKTFVLYDPKKPSAFVSEMSDSSMLMSGKRKCPMCRTGKKSFSRDASQRPATNT